MKKTLAIESPCGDLLVMDCVGAGDRTLLFIHGWTCRRAHWDRQLADLSRDHGVAALDLSGHGGSAHAGRSDWTVEGLCGDVLAAIDVLDAGEVVLVGHSMGGAVALEAGARKPEQAGVILVDTFVLPYGDLSEDDARGIEAPFHNDFTAAIADLVNQTAGSAMSEETRERLIQDMAQADPAWALPLWHNLLRWTPATAFEAIHAPIHAINGDLIPGHARQRCAPHVTEWHMPGAGHFPQMEQPETFNATLLRALNAL